MINRYVTTVVEDAKLVSNHSKKKIIDNEDIRLAVQMYNEQNFCSPPPKDVLLEVAQTRNSNPLPPPKPSSSTGVRLVSYIFISPMHCGRNCLNLVFKSLLITPNTTDIQAKGWMGCQKIRKDVRRNQKKVIWWSTFLKKLN